MSVIAEDINVEIDELRDRLERRNLLLDAVRKAYHRDVFAIRDCLLRMRNGEPLSSVLLSTSDLASVSSIDLREDPGFFLFSPHECELKLKPCHYCGGRFEVIHHESSRIKSLQTDLECSQAKLCQLGAVVDEQLTTINKLQDMQKILSSRLLECEFQLQFERYRYKQMLSECVDYRKDAHRITKWMEDYEKAKSLLEECSTKLSISYERAHLLSEELTSQQLITNKLRDDYQFEIRQNEELYRRCVSLEQALGSSNAEKSILREKLCQLEKDLLSLNRSHSQQTEYLRSLEHDEIHRKQTIDLLMLEKHHLNEVSRKTEICFNQQILDLKREMIESSLASESRYSQIADAFTRYQEEKKQELSSLQGMVHSLENMNASYIRLVYDRCLLFTIVLREHEDDIVPLNKPKDRRGKDDIVPLNKPKDRRGNAYAYINDCLNKYLDSDRLEWSTLLSDVCDRREVFGNMSNRLVSDSNESIQLIHILEEKRRTETGKLRRDYELRMSRDLDLYHEKISYLEMMVKEKGQELSMKDSLYSMAICDAESTRVEMKCIRDELSSSLDTIEVMDERAVDDNLMLDRLRKELEQEKSERHQLQLQMEHLKKNMTAHETSIDDLEKLLGRTSSRFAQMLAKEKERLDSNISRGIQVTPSTIDFGQQADFILQTLMTTDQSSPCHQPHPLSAPSHHHSKVYRSNIRQ